MINEQVERLLFYKDEELIIPAENVATVRTENTLLHALMVLQNVGYSAIPVLDAHSKFVGVITMPVIMRGIQEEVNYNWDALSQKKVWEVLDDHYATIEEDPELEDILHRLVDYNFLSVVDREGFFKGIITRKNMLKRVNFMAHEIDRFYDFEIKEELFSHIS